MAITRKFSGVFAPRPKEETARANAADDLARNRMLMSLRSPAPVSWMSDHLREDSRLSGVVYVAIKVLMDQAAEAELKVSRWHKDARLGADQDGKEPLERDHPLCRLLMHPNPREDGPSLRRRRVQQISLTGTSLLWRVDNGLGVPTELWSVPTGEYLPVAPNVTYPDGAYRIMPYYPGPLAMVPGAWGAGGVIVPAEHMVAARHPHPLVQWEGLSPMTACSLALDTIDSIDRARMNATRRVVQPSAVVELDPIVAFPDDVQLDRIRFQLQQLMGGPNKVGGVGLLGPGQKMSPWGKDNVEVGWIESWGQLVGFAMAVFGVTKSMGFMTDDDSFSALYARLKQFNLFTLCPLLGMLAEADNVQLVRPFWGEDYIVEYVPKKVDDDELIEKQLGTDAGAGNVRTVDEVRVLRGLKPFGDERGKAFFGAKPEPAPQQHQVSGLESLFGKQEAKPQAEQQEAHEVSQARPDNPEAEGALGPRQPQPDGKAWDESRVHRRPDGEFGEGGGKKPNKPVTHADLQQAYDDDRRGSRRMPSASDYANFPTEPVHREAITAAVHELTPDKYSAADLDRVYEHVRQRTPGLTPEKFRGTMARLHHEGRIELEPHTRATSELRNPEAVVPLGGNLMGSARLKAWDESKIRRDSDGRFALADRGQRLADRHHGRLRSLLGKLQRGEHKPADTLSHLDAHHEQALEYLGDLHDKLADEHHAAGKAAAHDVSGEPRDESGQWTAGSGSSKPKVKPGSFGGDKIRKKESPAANKEGTKPPSKLQEQARAIVAGKIKPAKERAFNGKPVSTKEKLSKQLAGAIGEEILIQHLKELGFKDATQLSAFMKTEKNNLPIDLIQDHELIEAKTGQASNGSGAQQWRLTIGEPGEKEKAWLASASAEDKAAFNAKKQKMIQERKQKMLQALAKKLGYPMKLRTMTVVINPDTKTADIYSFAGVHDRIGWNSDQAKAGYVRSVRYGD